MSAHWEKLCVCLHWHSSHAEGGGVCTQTIPPRRDGATVCKCMRFNHVSSKSRHAYHSGMRTAKTLAADVKVGERVALAVAADGRLVPSAIVTGAVVATVTRKDEYASQASWRQRPWDLITDLGLVLGVLGGEKLLVVTGP